MWIRDADIPEHLIEAQRSGSLVVFVGAGASVAPASSLPTFRRLAASIAEESNVPVTDEKLDEPDRLLGDLREQHDVDVHLRVAHHIDAPASTPNSLHQAVASLAATPGPVRIVTTNYDRHLSTALAERGVEVSEFLAPALPLGDDFNGVVYLHGSISQDPHKLVVTDADFGRAYLRDAWATRFLERMFATYTVLFIGFSHSDTVLSYLARGLGPESKRFAFTADPPATDWRRLGIAPVVYPNSDGSHRSLEEALAAWAHRASMGLLDHRRQIADLVSGSPSQIPEEAAYLESVLSDPEQVKFFTEYTTGTEWLAWASRHEVFRSLFDPQIEANHCSSALAYWFADRFALNEEFHGQALSVVQQSGGRLGSTVWHAIARALNASKGQRPSWMGAWVALLVQNATAGGDAQLDRALVGSRWPQDRSAALVLFDHLTEPVPFLENAFASDSPPRLDLRIRGDEYWLREAWGALFEPNIAEAASDLLVIVDRHLRNAHHTLVAAGTAKPGWDPMSYRRSAIEPHEQDRWSNVNTLIDAARDSLAHLVTSNDSMAHTYIDSWARSETPLLRRLALHGLTESPQVSATDKLVWLRERGWLFEHQLRHEVYHMLQNTLRDADVAVADQLVADALAFRTVDDDGHQEYEAFNLLQWMTRHAPDLHSARDAFASVQNENPDFEPRDFPDLLSWSVTGSVPYEPPITAGSLHQRISADPAAALNALAAYEGATPPFDRPTWTDALTLLEDTVRQWPVDGFQALEAPGGDRVDFVRAVLRGWSKADSHDDEAAESILGRIMDLDMAPMTNEIADFLEEGGRRDGHPTAWHKYQTSRQVAAMVWDAIEPAPPELKMKNWLATAINDPAGKLALFWLQIISFEWKSAGEAWSGIPRAAREQLDVMLDGTASRNALAEVVLASQVHFLFATDREWCQQAILPLLDWEDSERARRTWDGYLSWGRWHDTLLNSGLLDHYSATVAHYNDFESQSQEQLLEHLASISMLSEIDPVASGWVVDFTTGADPKARTEWISRITWLIRDMESETVETQWHRWMRSYWENRIDNVPRGLTFEEASAIAPWTFYLTDSMAEAATLGQRSPAGIVTQPFFLSDLAEGRAANAAYELAGLLTHMLTYTKAPFWHCQQLRTVVEVLRLHIGAEEVVAILEAATHLCDQAPEW